jgi:hypothetical protein
MPTMMQFLSRFRFFVRRCSRAPEEAEMGWLAGPVVLVALVTSSSAFAQTPVQGSPRVRGSRPRLPKPSSRLPNSRRRSTNS